MSDIDLAEVLRDERLRPCDHSTSAWPNCCVTCLRDRLFASDWLAAHDAEVGERIAQAILDNPGPDPSPADPAWWAGWSEGQSDAANIARAETGAS